MPRGSPIHTAIAVVAVNPSNQAEPKLVVVPVLPASVWPGICAAVPVPEVITPGNNEVTVLATAGASTWVHCGGIVTFTPLASVTLATACGVQCSPCAATVA